MLPMMQLPATQPSPRALGKAENGSKGDQSKDASIPGFVEALSTATPAGGKGQRTEGKGEKAGKTTTAQLMALLLSVLQGQNGQLQSMNSPPATLGGRSGAVGGETDPAGNAPAGGGAQNLADLQQWLASQGKSSGHTAAGGAGQGSTAPGSAQTLLALDPGTVKRLATLLGLPATDQGKLLDMLKGQGKSSVVFMQRLQAALAKADPQLLQQLQSRPVTVTAVSISSSQDPGQTTADTLQGVNRQGSMLSTDLSHGNRADTGTRSPHLETTPLRAAALSSGDRTGHGGNSEGKTGQDLLQGKGKDVFAKLKANTGSGHGAETTAFSLSGVGSFKGGSVHLQGASQPQGQLHPPSRAPLPEQQIVDQVTQGVGNARLKGTSSLTINMHPQELGKVKLELTLGKDGLKAHLHAETQQVQGVLAKHLPKLRHALEQQGLKLDEMQVSADPGGHSSGGGGFFSQHQNGTPLPFQRSAPRWAEMKASPEVSVAPVPAVTMSPANSGLSVRI